MYRNNILTDLLVFSDETSPSPAIAGVAAYEMEGGSHLHLFDIVEESTRDPLGPPVSQNFLRIAARALDRFHPGSRLEDHGWHISNCFYSANIDFKPVGGGGYEARIKGNLPNVNGIAPMSFYQEQLPEGPYYTLGGIEEDLGALQRDVTHVRYIVPVQYAPHGLAVLGMNSSDHKIPAVFDTARLYDGMVRDAMIREGLESVEALTERWQQQGAWLGYQDSPIPPMSRCREEILTEWTRNPVERHDFYRAGLMPEVYVSRRHTADLGHGREVVSALFNLGAECVPAALMKDVCERFTTAQTLWGLSPAPRQDFRHDTVARMRNLPLIPR